MNVYLKLEGFLSSEHVRSKECVPIFMAHPVDGSLFVLFLTHISSPIKDVSMVRDTNKTKFWIWYDT